MTFFAIEMFQGIQEIVYAIWGGHKVSIVESIMDFGKCVIGNAVIFLIENFGMYFATREAIKSVFFFKFHKPLGNTITAMDNATSSLHHLVVVHLSNNNETVKWMGNTKMHSILAQRKITA